MSSKEAINMPTKIQLTGKTYKIRSVGIMKIQAIIENDIKEKQKEKIRLVGDLLNEKERFKYVVEKGEKVPDGDALGDLAIEAMKGGDVSNAVILEILLEALIKDQPDMTLELLYEIFSNSTEEEQVIASKEMTGSKNVDSPPRNCSKRSPRSTRGRPK